MTGAVLVGPAMLAWASAVGGAWAEGKATITREESKPKDIIARAVADRPVFLGPQ
jgi:hypothetical protein